MRTGISLSGALVLFVVLVLAAGCATYSKGFRAVEERLANQKYADALQVLEKNKGPKRDRVLFLLNRGMVLRMNGDFTASNESFEQAKQISRSLEAVSISEQTGAVTINDSMRSYSGESYELVLLHLYKALNYLQLDEPDSARVEAMQIDVRLQELAQSGYHEDAFARYLMGLIFEELGEWDDALIAYRHAYDAYTAARAKFGVLVPSFLKYDLLRLAERQGMSDDLADYQASFNIDKWPSAADLAGKGELIVLVHNNLAPIKREHAIHARAPKRGQLLRISTPYYETRPLYVSDINVRAGHVQKVAVQVENIDAIARQALQRQMPAITARALARAVIKHQASKKLGKRDSVLGLFVNVAGLLTERADTRSWLTLPHNIFMARIPLDPGQYDVEVTLANNFGTVIAQVMLTGVNIRRHDKVYRSYHWIHAPGKK